MISHQRTIAGSGIAQLPVAAHSRKWSAQLSIRTEIQLSGTTPVSNNHINETWRTCNPIDY